MKPKTASVASDFLAICMKAGRIDCREVERKRLGYFVLMRGWRMESISRRVLNLTAFDGDSGVS